MKKIIFSLCFALLLANAFALETINMDVEHIYVTDQKIITNAVGKVIKKSLVDGEKGTASYEFAKKFPDFTIQFFPDHLTVSWANAEKLVDNVENMDRTEKAIIAIVGERLWLKISANLNKPVAIITPKVKINIAPNSMMTLIRFQKK